MTPKAAFVSNRPAWLGALLVGVLLATACNAASPSPSDDPAADVMPAWSPNGSQLAIVSTRDGNEEIYVINADEPGAARVTSDPADDGEPAWTAASGTSP
jgi:Tol biopolymer transport system component